MGTHVALEEEFETINPVERKGGSLRNHKPVEVKCEIYEPQVCSLFPEKNENDTKNEKQQRAMLFFPVS